MSETVRDERESTQDDEDAEKRSGARDENSRDESPEHETLGERFEEEGLHHSSSHRLEPCCGMVSP